MTEPLTPFEQEVLRQLLAGDDEVLGALRRQLPGCRVARRTVTGSGVLVELSVASGLAAELEGELHLAGAKVSFPSLRHGARFVLTAYDGVLEELEGFTEDEPWPSDVSQFAVTVDPARRELPWRAPLTPVPSGEEAGERERRLLTWILSDTYEDFGQIWSLAKRVSEEHGVPDWTIVRDETVRLLRELTHAGSVRVIGDLRPTGFEPWDGAPPAWVDRIEREWTALGRMPKVGELGWYDVDREALSAPLGP